MQGTVKIILPPAEEERYQQAKVVIREGLQTFVEVGTALIAVRENPNWYRSDDYKTFEEFCHKEYQISDNYGRRLMAAAEVVSNLKTVPIGTVYLPQTETQARPLASLPAEEQPAAWQAAQDAAAAEGKPVAARHVAAAVAEIKGHSAPSAAATTASVQTVVHRDAGDGPMFDGKTPRPVPMAETVNLAPAADAVDGVVHLQWFEHWSATYHWRDAFGNTKQGEATITHFSVMDYTGKAYRLDFDRYPVGDLATLEKAKARALKKAIEIQGHNGTEKASNFATIPGAEGDAR